MWKIIHACHMSAWWNSAVAHWLMKCVWAVYVYIHSLAGAGNDKDNDDLTCFFSKWMCGEPHLRKNAGRFLRLATRTRASCPHACPRWAARIGKAPLPYGRCTNKLHNVAYGRGVDSMPSVRRLRTCGAGDGRLEKHIQKYLRLRRQKDMTRHNILGNACALRAPRWGSAASGNFNKRVGCYS